MLVPQIIFVSDKSRPWQPPIHSVCDHSNNLGWNLNSVISPKWRCQELEDEEIWVQPDSCISWEPNKRQPVT